jgi:hypothetical protein
MEFLLGVLFTLIAELFIFIGVRSWRMSVAPDAPPKPRTAAQRANELAYLADQAAAPQARSLTVRRATQRGRRKVFPDNNA